MVFLNDESKNGNILVTGAAGFIGRHLVSALRDADASVRVLVRPERLLEAKRLWSSSAVTAVPADLVSHSSLIGVCENVRTVFHLAGYAHAEDANHVLADETHWQVTVEGTRALLREAARAGVRKFIFASTVKAMGEGGEDCLDETAALVPASGYGRAKRAAEESVLEAGNNSDMHTCVVRFPLIYGRGNKGNLPLMIEAIDRGRFPPLPRLSNKRSMVHVHDAVQALLLCAERPQGRGQIYIVTDGQAYSTSDLYRQIRVALGKGEPMWGLPLWVMRLGAGIGDLIGKLRGRPFLFDRSVFAKLTTSAWYGSDKIQRELGFRPTRTLVDGLGEMIDEYRERRRRET